MRHVNINSSTLHDTQRHRQQKWNNKLIANPLFRNLTSAFITIWVYFRHVERVVLSVDEATGGTGASWYLNYFLIVDGEDAYWFCLCALVVSIWWRYWHRILRLVTFGNLAIHRLLRCTDRVDYSVNICWWWAWLGN